MNEEKCFCHLNGFAVKDATARAEIEQLKASEHIDSEARSAAAEATAAAAAVQEQLNQHKTAEVIDSTARSAASAASAAAATNANNLTEMEGRVSDLENSAGIDTTARTAASEAKTAAATNANSITGHETRITALEGKSGGLTWKKVTLAELKTNFTETNLGKLVKVVSKKTDSNSYAFTDCIAISAINSDVYGLLMSNFSWSNNILMLWSLQISNSAWQNGISISKKTIDFSTATDPVLTDYSNNYSCDDSRFDFYIEE